MTPWLVGLPDPSPDYLRLVCFPYAGGGASAYLPWRRMPVGLNIQPVKLPGREARGAEPLVRDLDAVVDAVAAAVGDEVDAPFALFGHSLGALLAFETARRLEALGRGPRRLFVSARAAPAVPPVIDPFAMTDADLEHFLRDLDGSPSAVLNDDEYLRMVLPVLRADLELAVGHQFRADPALRCPVTVLYGYDDGIHRADLDAWSDVCSSPVTMRGFPGGHFFPFRESTAAVLAAIAGDTRSGADGRRIVDADERLGDPAEKE